MRNLEESEKKTGVGSKTKRALKVVLSAGALAVGVGGCGNNEEFPYEPAEQHALARYQQVFDGASPSGKFVLQYLRETRILEPSKNVFMGDDRSYKITINNGYLAGTAYDIGGGSIKASAQGIFSSAVVEGKIPTAAAVAVSDPENPDLLTIQSGNIRSIDLHFKGGETGNGLVPADKQTKNILTTTNHCQTGVVGHIEDLTLYVYDDASEYIADNH